MTDNRKFAVTVLGGSVTPEFNEEMLLRSICENSKLIYEYFTEIDEQGSHLDLDSLEVANRTLKSLILYCAVEEKIWLKQNGEPHPT